MISKLVLVFWGCSPGASIAGDCLAASAPACCYTTCRNPPPSPHSLVFAQISLFGNMSRLLLWCCDQCCQGAGPNCPSPNPAPWSWESPAVRGSTLLGPAQGDPSIGKKNVARVTRPMQVEDVKITASITSCCSTPPPLFRFYELTKRRLRLFS